MQEIWKDIPNYEGIYQISNLGRIKSLKGKEKILKLLIDKQGYYMVRLWENGKTKQFYIHRLVAEAFLDYKCNYKKLKDEEYLLFNKENLVVNHKDENKLNNNVNNLEWCTNRFNIKYTKEHYKNIVKIKEQIMHILVEHNISIEIIEKIEKLFY